MLYREIYSGEIVDGDEIDIVWEPQLGCYIRKEQRRESYLDDSVSDIDQYEKAGRKEEPE